MALGDGFERLKSRILRIESSATYGATRADSAYNYASNAYSLAYSAYKSASNAYGLASSAYSLASSAYSVASAIPSTSCAMAFRSGGTNFDVVVNCVKKSLGTGYADTAYAVTLIGVQTSTTGQRTFSDGDAFMTFSGPYYPNFNGTIWFPAISDYLYVSARSSGLIIYSGFVTFPFTVPVGMFFGTFDGKISRK